MEFCRLATRAVSAPAVAALLATATLGAIGSAAASNIWYAGAGPNGRPTTLTFELAADGTVEGRAFEAPAARGEAVGFDVHFSGTAREVDGRLMIEAVATGGDWSEQGVPLYIHADAVASRGASPPRPDAQGHALTTFLPSEGPSWSASLAAVAVGLETSTALDDGTLDVASTGPFFYADPWRNLSLAPDPFDLAESVATGLAQRASEPEVATANWYDRRMVFIEALTPRLVSVRIVFASYTGGAHPNTWFAFATWLRDAGGWQRAGVCDVVNALAYDCSFAALRRFIADDLLSQEAAWLVDGSVHAGTTWLLDPFTVTTAGLRFDYAPYDVGPYAQGPFTVEIPFELLR